MTLREFGLFVVTILTGVCGQFFLKTGALRLGKVNASNFLGHVLGILVTPELVFGLMLYAFSAVLYILLLTRVNLSVIGPSVSVGYIFSVMMGYFIFKEVITLRQVMGLGFIVCGVVLLAWKR